MELLPGLSVRAYYKAKDIVDEGGVLSAKCTPLVIHRDRLKPEATKDFITFVASRFVCMCVCVCRSVCLSVSILYVYVSSKLSVIPGTSWTLPMAFARGKANMTSTQCFEPYPNCFLPILVNRTSEKMGIFLPGCHICMPCRLPWPMERSSLFLRSCRETFEQRSDAQPSLDTRKF